MKKKKIYIGIAVIVVIGIAAFLLIGGKQESKVTYTEVEVTKSNITTSVTATGTIEPVTSVTVGTQVSGIVSHLYVDYNSTVKKGQVIAELDKTNLMSELASAKAQLQSAKASAASAKSTLTYQTSNYDRYSTLYKKGLISANDYDQAHLSFQTAKRSYEQALEQVNTAQQNVNKAQTNLGYATITSPIDGIVISKSVEEGQTVAASFNTPELFTIAQDLTNMQVIADIDEADIGDVRVGERVTFTVDAYPDDVFTGRVTQVRLEATTESNVVTYEVVISAANPDLKLKPGLTANVTIFTQEINNVVAIPSKALKFTPNEKMLTKDQSIQDCKAENKVWIMQGNVFKAIPVTVGLSNGMTTEIKSGLRIGQKIITEFNMGGEEATAEGESDNNPFMPHPPSSKNSKDAKSAAK